jgi:tRNA pseudouridine(38-40) synthase
MKERITDTIYAWGHTKSLFLGTTRWHFPYMLDLTLMREAADLLTGYQDFSCFCNERADYTRSTFCRIDEIKIKELSESRLCISIKGSPFFV